MSHPRIAALQMVSSNVLEDNLSAAAELIAQAAQAGAALAVLPENFAMFSTRKQHELGREEAFGAKTVQQFLAEQARQHNIWLVAGTIPVAAQADAERVLPSCLVFNSQGEEVARYHKMHLFDVDVADQQGSYRESDTFQAGNEIVTVATPFGCLGVAVCYDLRFPELFRALFTQGVDVIAVPAAFTRLTGEAHWLPLLRARAIENQCYMIGANQGGQHGKSRTTSGGSVIIDGWGNVLTEAARGEACVVADMDLKTLQQQRQAMPIANHLRFDVVRK